MRGSAIASPFNVSDDFKEQHFQCEELAVVVQAYATEHGVELPQHFTEDLFASTHGYTASVVRFPTSPHFADRRHPGLTMLALREYHENAVVQCARNFGGNVPPSWESFCHQHFWAVMLANRSLVTAVSAATSSQLCCSFIERRGLLLLSGSFELGMVAAASQHPHLLTDT